MSTAQNWLIDRVIKKKFLKKTVKNLDQNYGKLMSIMIPSHKINGWKKLITLEANELDYSTIHWDGMEWIGTIDKNR